METQFHIVPGTYNRHNMFKMHDLQYMSNMFTPVTQGGKILDIDLVLGQISSTIQIVPLNENQRDPDGLT
jgi:hypothetical protein